MADEKIEKAWGGLELRVRAGVSAGWAEEGRDGVGEVGWVAEADPQVFFTKTGQH